MRTDGSLKRLLLCAVSNNRCQIKTLKSCCFLAVSDLGCKHTSQISKQELPEFSIYRKAHFSVCFVITEVFAGIVFVLLKLVTNPYRSREEN